MLVAMAAVGRGSARAAARDIIKGQGGVHVPLFALAAFGRVHFDICGGYGSVH